MTWFSFKVIGGSIPLRIFDNMLKRCFIDLEDFYNSNNGNLELYRDTFNRFSNVMLEMVESTVESNIAAQVLGYIIIESGAIMSPMARKVILNGIANDSWANEDEDRLRYMTTFYHIVENYTNTPVVVNYEQLSDDYNVVFDLKNHHHDLEEWLPEHEDDEG